MEESKRARQSIDRILAGRDRMTRDEKLAVFERVVRHEDVRPAPRRALRWSLAAIATAAAAYVFVVLPRQGDELTPRGGERPSFTVVCYRDARPSPCERGATLVFELAPRPGDDYFAAFARAPGGKVIWYFPEDEETVGLATAASKKGVASRGIELAEEHPPGHYAVTGLFSARGLDRAEIRRIIEGKSADPGIVERTFDVVSGGD